MAPPVRVQLTEASVALKHVPEGGEGGKGAFLLDKAGVQNAAVRVVEHHHQVLHGQLGQPGVGGRIEVKQHAHQRPALAPPSVLAPPRSPLREPCVLERLLAERVGQLQPMPLGDVLMEVRH